MSTAVNIKRKYKMKEVNASLVRRGIAFMIDWYIGSVLTSLPVLAILQKVNPNAEPVLEMRSLPYTMAILASILGLLVTIAYYVILPYIWKGQTLGKRCLKIQIKEEGKEQISLMGLIKRQLLGIVFVEGSLYSVTPMIWQVIFYGNASYQQTLTWAYYGITVVSVLLLIIGKRKKMIHDYIGNTYVVAK